MYIQISKNAAEMLVSLLQNRQEAIKSDASEGISPFSELWDDYYCARELEGRLLDLINAEDHE